MNRHGDTQITATSYKASIEDSDLAFFLAAGWIAAQSIEAITERQLRQCVSDRCIWNMVGEHVYLINESVREVAMRINVLKAGDRIWSLHWDSTQALKANRYEFLPTTKPHLEMAHTMSKVKPPPLKARMLDSVYWRKGQNFHKQNFQAFMRELAEQARKFQDERLIQSCWTASDTGDNPFDINAKNRAGTT